MEGEGSSGPRERERKAKALSFHSRTWALANPSISELPGGEKDKVKGRQRKVAIARSFQWLPALAQVLAEYEDEGRQEKGETRIHQLLASCFFPRQVSTSSPHLHRHHLQTLMLVFYVKPQSWRCTLPPFRCHSVKYPIPNNLKLEGVTAN